MVTLADIERARGVIAGHVLRTPMLPAPPLSALTGAEVFVKYENLQVTNSFKERGALQQACGARCRKSAGAASSPCRPATMPRPWPITRARLAIPATIVMPLTTPFVKVEATEALWRQRRARGETLAEARRAPRRSRPRRLILVHPYDDPR